VPRFKLSELIAREFQADDRDWLATVMSGMDDRQIESWVAALVRERFGSDVVGASFAAGSVGAVFGLDLARGDRVVLKIFHPTQPTNDLRASERCHAIALERGFPAPRILRPLFEAEGLRAAFYEFLDGEQLDAHRPEVRRELARSLAELSELLEGVDPSGLTLAPTRGPNLFPPSHKQSSLEGESPLDDIVRRAQRIALAENLPLGVFHFDWGTKNIRFRQDRVCAVYDWDSLYAASEAEAAGRAAAQFTVQWDFPATRLTPTLDECRAFLEDYQAARGRSFSVAELRVAWASGCYLAAHVARYYFAAGSSDNEFVRLLRELAAVVTAD
jgi:hypothetical protein